MSGERLAPAFTREGWWVVAIVALAVTLRVAHLVALSHTPWWTHLVVDPAYYDAWARRIAAGDWMGDRAFYMDPLHPYLLAVLYRVSGRDLLAARLLNVLCSAGSCVLVWRLGRRVGGPATGALAALGLALYRPEIFYTGEIDKTSLSVALTALALVLALGTTLPARLGAGAALGLGGLTRANLLLFAPLGMLVFLRDPGDRGRRVGRLPRAVCGTTLFATGFFAVILPVTWRNHHVAGEWVLTTTPAGQTFYTGNNPSNPYGAYGAVPFVRSNPAFEEADFRAAAEARAGRPLGPNEVSNFWFRAGLAHIRDAPAFAARALGYKLVLFWNDFEISDNQDQYLLARDSWVLRLPLPGFGAVASLGFLGVALTFRQRRDVRLLAAFVLVYWLSLSAFFLFSRYRIQVVAALLPLAALGVGGLAERARAAQGLKVATAAAIIAGGALLSFHRVAHFWPEQGRVVEMRLRNLADAYVAVGEPDRAIAVLKEAIAPCTHGCPWALNDLYNLYLRTGRYAEGETYFRSFIPLHPGQEDAPGYLAHLVAERAAHDGG